MKLSEAIRAGAELHEQGRGFMAQSDERGIYTCALGAAFEAAFDRLPQFERDDAYDTARLHRRYPELLRRVQFPVAGSYHDSEYLDGVHLGIAVAELNDTYDWTREQIADWVESLGY